MIQSNNVLFVTIIMEKTTILTLLPCDLTVKTNGFYSHVVAHMQIICKKFIFAVYCKNFLQNSRVSCNLNPSLKFVPRLVNKCMCYLLMLCLNFRE